jgi:hypothetical protein
MNLLPDGRQQSLMDETERLLIGEGPSASLLGEWATRHWFAIHPSGTGLLDQIFLFRMLGTHLAPGPFLATTLAAGLAAECGEGDLSRRIAEGRVPVALAQSDGLAPSVVGIVTRGTFRAFDAPGSRYVLVMSPDTVALVERDGNDEMVERTCVDPGTSMGTLTLANRARCLGGSDWWTRGAVLVAAMAAGIAEATRDDAADYAKSRSQFGRPIGTFQAIKHRCSEMAIQAEAAWCQVAYAALSLSDGHEDAADQASAAKVVAIRAAELNASSNIQIHGALGCTTEHGAHLYLKRTLVLEYLCGSTEHHQRNLLRNPTADL